MSARVVPFEEELLPRIIERRRLEFVKLLLGRGLSREQTASIFFSAVASLTPRTSLPDDL